MQVDVRPPQPPEEDEDESILKAAQLQFRRCVSWDSPWAGKAKDELNFVDGLEHWNGEMRDERKGKPCLTFDRIGPAIDQVVNDARQNPPEAKFSPVGNGADKDTAEILQGIDRNIDQDSAAITAYMTAYEHAVKIGRGAWRVHIEYEDDDTFSQKLVVKRIANPFSVYPDPACEEFDYSDMRFCFVTEDIDVETFKQLYPDASLTLIQAGTSWESANDKIRTEWFPGGSIRIAEYWWVEFTEERLVQLKDGSIVVDNDKENPKYPKGSPNVVNERKAQKRKVYGAKLTGGEVLDKWEWPGKWIPVVICAGREIIKDGKRQLRGMIRPAMDANLMYDFARSKEMETIGLSAIAQWLVAEGSVEGFEYQWAQANRKNLPFLEYKVKNGDDQLPPPQRIWPEGPLAAISAAVASSADDIRSTTSTYQPSLGDAPPEASGRAITARQRESDNAHFNFHDNLYRALRHSARIKLDLMPHVYSEARLISIVNPDGTSKMVQINQPFFDKGLQKIYSLSGAARYDVTIGTGPSYPAQRAEAAEKLVQLAQFIPAIQQRAPDLLVKAVIDTSDADQLADRLRPLDIQQEADGQPPIPPGVQAALAQKDQAIQALLAQVQEMKTTIDAKLLDIASRERIAARGDIANMVIAEFKANADAAQQAMQNQIAALEARMQRDHERDTLTQELGADMDQLRAQQQHEQQLAQQQAQQQQMAQQPPQTPPAAPPQGQ